MCAVETPLRSLQSSGIHFRVVLSGGYAFKCNFLAAPTNTAQRLELSELLIDEDERRFELGAMGVTRHLTSSCIAPSWQKSSGEKYLGDEARLRFSRAASFRIRVSPAS
jgi:hypothetical protein